MMIRPHGYMQAGVSGTLNYHFGSILGSITKSSQVPVRSVIRGKRAVMKNVVSARRIWRSTVDRVVSSFQSDQSIFGFRAGKSETVVRRRPQYKFYDGWR